MDPLPVTSEHTRAFQDELLKWYHDVHRDMPWRRTSDPYRIWLSEVMLQQTRVDQAEPYYRRFVERFPTVDALADAALDDVLLCWEGLGYYSRARNLHRAARRVVDDHDGRLPDDEAAIRDLPGVGPYTAAAVLSIAFHKPHPALDGNVVRVLTRIFAVEADAKRTATRRRLRDAARRLMDDTRPGVFNQAVMELGATICAPRSPACPTCPVRTVCAAAASGDPEAYPVSAPRKAIPHFDIAVGLVQDHCSRLLIQRRPEDGMLGGLWEFPGGKREDGETAREACVRELREELGVMAIAGPLYHKLSHAYSHFKITLHAFPARIVEGEPASSLPLRWVAPEALGDFAFPRANRKLIEHLARDQPGAS